MKKYLLASTMVLLLLVLSACPGKSPAQTLTKELISEKALDGYVIDRAAGEVISQIEYLAIGDFSQNQVVRGFVSFDLRALPNGSKIDKAELSLYQRKGVAVSSNRPYSRLGWLLLGHINYGDSLDGDDLKRGLLSNKTLILSKDASIGWKILDVTDWVQDDMQNHRSSQFRIQFSKDTDNDNRADTVWLVSANKQSENMKAFKPVLKITYTTP